MKQKKKKYLLFVIYGNCQKKKCIYEIKRIMGIQLSQICSTMTKTKLYLKLFMTRQTIEKNYNKLGKNCDKMWASGRQRCCHYPPLRRIQ